MAVLERWFRISENHTTVRTEILAGVTTFLTMAYYRRPTGVLSGKMLRMSTGMDFWQAVMTATCLSAALATILMALTRVVSIAQAPGMGENFFFVFSVIPAATAAGSPMAGRSRSAVVFLSACYF